jgi:hypothetical protein
MQYRRLAALLLGAWLGASIFSNVAVRLNFQTVDRFLESPGNPATSVQLNSIGRAREHSILRRNAAEENNWIFLNWERVELAMGGALFLLLLFGDRLRKSLLALSLIMLAIVLVEHFLFTPWITELGRIVDDLPATDPEYRRYRILHALYSGLDVLKILTGFVFAVRLAVRRTPDSDAFAREYAASFGERSVRQGSVRSG